MKNINKTSWTIQSLSVIWNTCFQTKGITLKLTQTSFFTLWNHDLLAFTSKIAIYAINLMVQTGNWFKLKQLRWLFVISYKHYRTMHSQLFILLQLQTFDNCYYQFFFGCGEYILMYRLFTKFIERQNIKLIEGLDKAKEIF